MKKQKSKFICRQCGFETPRWLGRCPDCGAWNSFDEEAVKSRATGRKDNTPVQKPTLLDDVRTLPVERIDMGMEEFNRVLGGGLVPGTIVLLAGDPGIGKSTLLLQAASHISQNTDSRVLYISGEESAQQIKMRAARMGMKKAGVYVWAETGLERIEDEIRTTKPTLVIVDSIQTVYSGDLPSFAGSVAQIREGTARLLALAKGFNIPIIIVGHVTKDGNIAGPRVLEHMVDTVLHFEGERHYQYRILRTVKNRFGSTFEMGVFEMKSEGIAEITNPSQAFLAERPLLSPGSVVTACMEGTRPLLVEIQALVTGSSFGQPRRMSTGMDINRVNLMLAILEKRVGLSLAAQDAYLNVVGGMKVQEPALDLAVAVAIASSLKNRPCVSQSVIMGEVGLTGEVRGISHIQKRVREAQKMGFNSCILPQGCAGGISEGVELIEVKTVNEAIGVALI